MAPNNHKFVAKFHSGTLRIIDRMRLMSLFQLLLEHLSEFVSGFLCKYSYYCSVLKLNISLVFI